MPESASGGGVCLLLGWGVSALGGCLLLGGGCLLPGDVCSGGGALGGCLLQGGLLLGVSALGGVSAPGGVCSWGLSAPGGCVSAPGGCLLLRGVCSWGCVSVPQGGCVCSSGDVCLFLRGCLLPGGSDLWGVSALGGCLLRGWGCLVPGGCLLLGEVSAQGGCLLPGGVGIPACTEADTPPPREQNHTHTCKNITLAQLRCGR